MSGRFPLYTDENVKGPLIKALRNGGWDLVRAVDVLPEGTEDEEQFEYAARENRVFVSSDEPFLAIASRWLREGRPFRMVTWPQEHHKKITITAFVRKFEALARAEHPFANYPLVHINPDSPELEQ